MPFVLTSCYIPLYFRPPSNLIEYIQNPSKSSRYPGFDHEKRTLDFSRVLIVGWLGVLLKVRKILDTTVFIKFLTGRKIFLI